ncbi:MAG: hypothetical protein GF414_04470 [Candidatus Altiarchaeales archaeon]|nr:hypothetical protein [Candidatus Altiarchaeales archaeon]
MGEQEICGHEVLVHDDSLRRWTSEVRDLVEGKLNRDVVYFPMESPELIARLWRNDYGSGSYYELLIALDTGVFDLEPIISGEGPGVLLSPKADALLQFNEDLLAEAEVVS